MRDEFRQYNIAQSLRQYLQCYGWILFLSRFSLYDHIKLQMPWQDFGLNGVKFGAWQTTKPNFFRVESMCKT